MISDKIINIFFAGEDFGDGTTGRRLPGETKCLSGNENSSRHSLGSHWNKNGNHSGLNSFN
jgi:hypothetical protein